MAVVTPRASWKGRMTVNLISVPIKLCTCIKDSDIHFNEVVRRNDGYEKVQRQKVDSNGGTVESDEILKGFDTGNGFVIVSEDELLAVQAEQNKNIEIDRFIPEKELNPTMFQKPYYVFPDKGGEQPYALLVKAMQKTKRAAVGTFVNRTRQYIVIVRVQGSHLVAQVVYFPEEVVPCTDVDDQLKPLVTKVDPDHLKLACQLIEQASGEFDPERHRNVVAQRTLDLIESKIRGKAIELVETAEKEQPMPDIIEALQQSLAQRQTG